MRISAQRMYNTAKAGEHGMLAFMLECKDTAQNFSWSKLAAAASDCQDPVARLHTLLVLAPHTDQALALLTAPVENYHVRTKLARWVGVAWNPEWDEMLSVWMDSKVPLSTPAWARAAYINNKPLEYVLKLCERVQPDAPQHAIQHMARVIRWSKDSYSYGDPIRADQRVPVERDIAFIDLCEARGYQVSSHLLNYSLEYADISVTKRVFEHLVARNVSVTNSMVGEMRSMQLALQCPELVAKFLAIQAAAPKKEEESTNE